jgi:hypothetical protein
MSTDNLVAKLTDPSVSISIVEIYSTAQLAAKFGVPEYCWRRIVQDENSGLGGQKVGRQYFVLGSDVVTWIQSGKFKYTPRPSTRKKPLSEDIERAEKREKDRRSRSI